MVAVLRRRTKKWILFHEEAGVFHNECSLHLVKCINRIWVLEFLGWLEFPCYIGHIYREQRKLGQGRRG